MQVICEARTMILAEEDMHLVGVRASANSGRHFNNGQRVHESCWTAQLAS